MSKQDHGSLEEKRHIDVAAGLIWKNSQLLISKRKIQDSFGGFWEFPGGKQKPDETLENCLIREIEEELDIVIKVVKRQLSLEQDFPLVAISLHLFDCQYFAGVPKAIECEEWRWISVSELAKFKFTALDRQAVKLLFKI